MTKFSKGEIVLCVKDYPGWLTAGKNYQILSGNDNVGITVTVKGDNGDVGGFYVGEGWFVSTAIQDASSIDDDISNLNTQRSLAQRYGYRLVKEQV